MEWLCIQLELKKVQQVLFAWPQLRNMVGANVLLGEYFRVTLAGFHATLADLESLPEVGNPVWEQVPGHSNHDVLLSGADDPKSLYVGADQVQQVVQRSQHAQFEHSACPSAGCAFCDGEGGLESTIDGSSQRVGWCMGLPEMLYERTVCAGQ